jgi:uncharacterized RDD family membrane protein YckC
MAAPARRSPESGAAYPGLVTRAIAIVIDAALIDLAALAVTGAVLLVKSVFSVSGKHHGVAAALGIVLFVVWVVSYFAFFWTTTGQTPGSRVMHIRVTRADGSRLRLLGAVRRLVGMVVSLPLFWGYLPILWSPRRRGVPDVVAGAVVTVVAPVQGLDQDDVAPGRRNHPSGIDPASTVP